MPSEILCFYKPFEKVPYCDGTISGIYMYTFHSKGTEIVKNLAGEITLCERDFFFFSKNFIYMFCTDHRTILLFFFFNKKGVHCPLLIIG